MSIKETAPVPDHRDKMRLKIRARERQPSRFDLVHPDGLTPFGAVLLAAAVLLAGLLLIAATGESRASQEYFTVSQVTLNSESRREAFKGSSFCRIDGTFGGATASMRTEVQGIGLEADVSSLVLVGATAATDWETIGLGHGSYWLDVVGGDGTTLLSLHCRREGP